MVGAYKVSIKLVYFSNHSGNTRRFVEKLAYEAQQIPIRWNEDDPLIVDFKYVLCVPTYGGGNDNTSIPKQVKKFLNVPANRSNLVGIIGFGNTNFGEHFCKAADLISQKTGAPVIARVEIFGTSEDVQRVTDRLEEINGQL
jgi:protein involved in ribonucleotide reduction